VLFGIPEDIGVKANLGIGGAHTAWEPFLKSFLNFQNNAFADAEDVLLLGYFDFSAVRQLIIGTAPHTEESIAAYRNAVNLIDEEVEELSKVISHAGKIPIAIGGGHNNAYPLIKGTAKGLYKRGQIPSARINCINLDAHTDFRVREGRHSGNPFRYAATDGFLEKYCIIGVNENSISQNVLSDLEENPLIKFFTYEEMFVREHIDYPNALWESIELVNHAPVGIETDLDVIQNTLSSAETPCGISPRQARRYIHLCAEHTKPAYLHICEGALALENGRRYEPIGKLISFL